jgi:hypothetical protein
MRGPRDRPPSRISDFISVHLARFCSLIPAGLVLSITTVQPTETDGSLPHFHVSIARGAEAYISRSLVRCICTVASVPHTSSQKRGGRTGLHVSPTWGRIDDDAALQHLLKLQILLQETALCTRRILCFLKRPVRRPTPASLPLLPPTLIGVSVLPPPCAAV